MPQRVNIKMRPPHATQAFLKGSYNSSNYIRHLFGLTSHCAVRRSIRDPSSHPNILFINFRFNIILSFFPV